MKTFNIRLSNILMFFLLRQIFPMKTSSIEFNSMFNTVQLVQVQQYTNNSHRLFFGAFVNSWYVIIFFMIWEFLLKTFIPVLRIFDNEDDLFIFSRNVRKSSASEFFFKSKISWNINLINLYPLSFFVNTPFKIKNNT